MNFWQRSDFIFSLTKAKIRHDHCLQVLHSFTNQIVENRRETLGKDSLEAKATYEDEDIGIGIKKKMALLDVLIQAKIDDKPLTNAEIAEEVDTFMFEGKRRFFQVSSWQTIEILSRSRHCDFSYKFRDLSSFATR